MNRVVILGAGAAGLGAAYFLSQNGYKVTVLDRAHYLGGASASFKIKDYIVDYGPHAFHIKNKEIVKLVEDLVGDDCIKVKRKSRLILDGKNLQYPLNIKEAFFKINPVLSSKIILDYLKVKISRIMNPKGYKINSFEDWGIDAFGYTLYRLAFGDYSEKMWGVSGKKLARELAQQKLLKLDLKKLILKVFGIGDSTMEGGIREFYDLYPRFGIGTIFDKMAEVILKDGSNKIYLDTQITRVESSDGKATKVHIQKAGAAETIESDYIVSSIPLKYLANYLLPQANEGLPKILSTLNYRDVRIIYIVLDKDYYSDVHWFYLLDSHFKFNRLSEQKNLNKESSPPGKTVISLDIACNNGDRIWDMPGKELFKLALNDIGHMGIEKDHILDYFTLRLEDVYPIYNLGFKNSFDELLNILAGYRNVYSTGRQGLFLNNDIHDSLEMGTMAGKFVLDGKDSIKWYDHIGRYISNRLEGNIK